MSDENVIEDVAGLNRLTPGEWVIDADGDALCLVDTHLGWPQRMWMPKANPVTEGHRLFIPNLHVERADTSPMATGATFEMASTWAAQRGGDFNLIVNAGTLASQTVPHLHVHYVPRRRGDGLKLPWTDQHAGSTGTGNQGDPS